VYWQENVFFWICRGTVQKNKLLYSIFTFCSKDVKIKDVNYRRVPILDAMLSYISYAKFNLCTVFDCVARQKIFACFWFKIPCPNKSQRHDSRKVAITVAIYSGSCGSDCFIFQPTGRSDSSLHFALRVRDRSQWRIRMRLSWQQRIWTVIRDHESYAPPLVNQWISIDVSTSIILGNDKQKHKRNGLGDKSQMSRMSPRVSLAGKEYVMFS